MEYAILFLPLIGSILGFLAKYIGDYLSQITTTVLICITAILSIILFYNGITSETYSNYLIYQWVASGNFVVNWSINKDPQPPSTVHGVVVSVNGQEKTATMQVWAILENGKHKKTDRRVTQPISKLTVIKYITKEKTLNSEVNV